MEDTAFGRFEKLLALPQPIKNAERAKKQWCTRTAHWNNKGPRMLQCDNLKCPVVWCHHECVGLEENCESDLWLCHQCKRNRPSNELCGFDDEEEIDKKHARLAINVTREERPSPIFGRHTNGRAQRRSAA